MHSSVDFHEVNVYACKQQIKKQNMTGAHRKPPNFFIISSSNFRFREIIQMESSRKALTDNIILESPSGYVKPGRSKRIT